MVSLVSCGNDDLSQSQAEKMIQAKLDSDKSIGNIWTEFLTRTRSVPAETISEIPPIGKKKKNIMWNTDFTRKGY
jgi:hypothetical protein